MSEQMHTAEPWHVDSDVVRDAYGTPIKTAGAWVEDAWRDDNATEESTANARRIVACVNACEGISTESLEKKRGDSYFHPKLASMMIKSVREQREELLSSLKELVAWHGKRGGEKDELLPTDAQEAEIQRAMLVIAKAEANHD